MSTHAAVFIVVGSIIVIAGPILWWIFFRMDCGPDVPQDPAADDPTPMTNEEVARVESELQVIMPSSLRNFLLTDRNTDEVDFGTVAGSPEGFIEMTKEYRAGFVGLPPWPKEWLYVGDASDACPYVLDCATEKMFQLHKGDVRDKRLAHWDTFDHFLEYQKACSAEASEPAGKWDFLYLVIPLLGVLLVFAAIGGIFFWIATLIQ